jgi:hypothetical protein
VWPCRIPRSKGAKTSSRFPFWDAAAVVTDPDESESGSRGGLYPYLFAAVGHGVAEKVAEDLSEPGWIRLDFDLLADDVGRTLELGAFVQEGPDLCVELYWFESDSERSEVGAGGDHQIVDEVRDVSTLPCDEVRQFLPIDRGSVPRRAMWSTRIDACGC